MPPSASTFKLFTSPTSPGRSEKIRISYPTLLVRGLWDCYISDINYFTILTLFFFHCFTVKNVLSVLEPYQAWTGFYASRNLLKGVARKASSQLHAAETLFVRYRIAYPDGPVATDWALEKLRTLRWAVSEVLDLKCFGFPQVSHFPKH